MPRCFPRRRGKHKWARIILLHKNCIIVINICIKILIDCTPPFEVYFHTNNIGDTGIASSMVTVSRGMYFFECLAFSSYLVAIQIISDTLGDQGDGSGQCHPMSHGGEGWPKISQKSVTYYLIGLLTGRFIVYMHLAHFLILYTCNKVLIFFLFQVSAWISCKSLA